jgi:hypothetical protein
VFEDIEFNAAAPAVEEGDPAALVCEDVGEEGVGVADADADAEGCVEVVDGRRFLAMERVWVRYLLSHAMLVYKALPVWR